MMGHSGLRQTLCVLGMGIGIAGLSACVTPTPTVKSSGAGGSDMHRLETLHGFVAYPDSLEVRVISNGCTQPNDFEIETTMKGQTCRVAIYRTKPDYCRRAPTPVSLTLPWPGGKECDIHQIKLQNRVEQERPLIRK